MKNKILNLPKKHPLVTALLGFTFVTFLLLNSLVLNITTKTVGYSPNVATSKSIWHYWFFPKLLSGEQKLTATDLIFYPDQPNLILDSNEFVNALFTLPFQFLGLITATNILVILSLIITAFGTFLVARKLTGNNFASFWSGIVFTFAPVVITHLAHGSLNIALTWPLPWHIYFLILSVREKKWYFGLVSGLLLAALTYNYLVHLAIFIPLSGLLALYLLTQESNNHKKIPWRGVFWVAVIYLSWLILVSPLLFGIFQAKSYIPMEVPLSVQNFWSPGLERFILPTARNLFFNNFANPKQDSEFGIYLGISTLVIFLSAVVTYFKRKKGSYASLGFWLALTLFFFILSLGPTLHLGDKPLTNSLLNFRLGDIQASFPLPFIIYQKLPFIGGIQEPVRFVYPLMFSLAMVAGIFIRSLQIKMTRPKRVLLVMIILGLVIDFLLVKIPVFSFNNSPIYQQIALDAKANVVLDIPIGRVTGNGAVGSAEIDDYSYFQTIHHKKLINGFVARAPGWMVTDLQKGEALIYLLEVQKYGCPKLGEGNPKINADLISMNIDYILIHKDKLLQSIRSDYYSPGAESLPCFVRDSGYKVIYSDNNIIGLKASGK